MCGHNDCSSAIFDLNQPSPISNLITTVQVDTDVKNENDPQYFATSIKYNYSAPETRDTNTTTTQIQVNLYHSLCQQSP